MKVYLPVAALILGAGVFLLGANAVSAQSTGESLVEKISNRFNLNQDEVQTFFDELKDERKAERAENFSNKLQEKVDDGTITAEQKTLIEEKFAELRDQKESIRDSDLTKEEMKEQLSQTREDLKAWAEENGINLDDVLPDKKEFKRHHRLHKFDGDSQAS